MLMGKLVAVIIFIILIIYNAINVRFQPFILLVVFCISILASFILMLLKARKISLFFEKKRYLYEAIDRACVRIISKNKSSMPITNVNFKLSAKNNDTRELQKISFVSQEKADTVITASVPGNHCGAWTINAGDAYFLDMFKIFKKRIKFEDSCEVIILPDCNYPVEKELYKLNRIFEETELTTQDKGSDVSEIVDVRDYIPGDKLNLIHWKISSKRDKLTVKELGSQAQKSVKLYLDSCPKDADTRDDIMCALYSIALWLINCDITFDIVSENNEREAAISTIYNKAELTEAIIEILKNPDYESSDAVRNRYLLDRQEVLNDCYYITENGIGGV